LANFLKDHCIETKAKEAIEPFLSSLTDSPGDSAQNIAKISSLHACSLGCRKLTPIRLYTPPTSGSVEGPHK